MAPESEPAATEAPAPEPNIAVYNHSRMINELDPSLVLSSETNVLWNVWGNLTLWDPDEGVIGMLADSWESNEDATVWTFHLRDGVKCHDGTDLTAEAVKLSYERTIEKGALAYVFAPVDTVEAVDDSTVRINLNYPARLPELLANNWGTFIMCPAALDQPAEWFAAGNEVGAGPYMIESYEPGQRMVLTKFEDWWQGWPEGSYDKVILEIVEDAAVRVQKLRGGEFYNPDTEFNIMFIGMYIGFDSPNEYLGSLWHSGWTWYPFSGFASEEFDTLVEQALALEAVDWDEADRLYQQAEQILYDQAVAVFALDLPQDWAIASDMAGFKPNPLYGYAAFLWTTYRQ